MVETLACLKSTDENCVRRLFLVPVRVIWTDVDSNLDDGKCGLNSDKFLLDQSKLFRCLRLELLREAVKNCMGGKDEDVINDLSSSHGGNYVCDYRYENGSWKVVEAITMP